MSIDDLKAVPMWENPFLFEGDLDAIVQNVTLPRMVAECFHDTVDTVCRAVGVPAPMLDLSHMISDILNMWQMGVPVPIEVGHE